MKTNSHIKEEERRIYDYRKGIGTIEGGSWWDKAFYNYLESYRAKVVRLLYDLYLRSKECLVLGCGDDGDIQDFEELTNNIVTRNHFRRVILITACTIEATNN